LCAPCRGRLARPRELTFGLAIMRSLVDLVGKIVTLSPLRPEHVGPAYVAWLNDPETTRFTEVANTRNDESSVRQYVEEAAVSETAAMWRICIGEHHVGNIRISDINRRHKRAAIAILIGEADKRGHGIGTEAIKLSTDYAFVELGIEKLTAGIYAGNKASRKAFEKAGYRCDAILSRHAILEGRRVDVLQYVRFAADYASI
jgi:RimJ/RimL family protein N-acetyltransferase